MSASSLTVRSAAFTFATAIFAQSTPVTLPGDPSSGDPHPFRVPIHVGAPDEQLGAYGTWASGDDYKASFHDGFVFVPVLGREAPTNLPWRWRTTAVQVGHSNLVSLAESAATHTDWRCEYHFGGDTFVEAYDVLPNGVEQSFVLASRPTVDGDLVITGRVESPLIAVSTAAAHRAIGFADACGIVRVTYGAATAIDAGGARQPISTSYDGAQLRLTVPGDWLAHAAFPITVDPLASAATLSQSFATAANTVIHRHEGLGMQRVMIAYTRYVSASDEDAYAQTTTGGLTDQHPVFADVTGSWSSTVPDVTYCGGVDRWVVSFWRHTGGEDRLRVYFHDQDNLTLNSGVIDSAYNPVGEHVSFPAIGGNSNPVSGWDAVVVYRMDPLFGNSSSSQVHAALVDAGQRHIISREVIENTLDAESPDITCQRGWYDDGYVVVYQARSSALDDYDLFVRKVFLDPFTNQLSATPEQLVGPDGLGDKVRPVVQGWDGRYMVAALQDVTPETNGQYFGRNVLTVRLDWLNGASAPTVQAHQLQSTSPNQDLTHLSLAFAGGTRSHWCLGHDTNAFTGGLARVTWLGASGGALETQTLGIGTYHVAAVADPVASTFLIANVRNDNLHSVQMRLLLPSDAAWNLAYGNGCGGGQISATANPYPGSLEYGVTLASAPPGMPALLCLSLSVGAFDLGPLGAPNCWANIGPIVTTLGGTTDAGGNCVQTIVLPDVPLWTGDLYWQWLYLWPAAPTPLTIGATRGMRSSVRW